MGLFDFGKKVYAGIVTTIAKPIVKTIAKVTKQPAVKPLTSQQFLKTKVGEALAGAATITAGAIVGVGALEYAGAVGAKGVATALKPIGAKIVAKPIQALAVGGIIAGGGLKLVEPAFQKLKTATQTAVPVLLGEEKLTKENVVDVGKVAGTILGVGIVGAGAGLIAKAVMGKDKAIEGATSILGGIQGQSPILPETAKITPTKTASKRRRATKPQSVKQSVKINIINRSTSTGIRNRTYLKERLLN